MTALGDRAEQFAREMPYRHAPYTSRNWGSRWHSLCSYHGKLKPAIAHFLITFFTEPGDVVLDPLCGVGTIPFEACQQGRLGIGNDLSPLAYCVTRAKVSQPSLESTMMELGLLKEYIDKNKGELDLNHLPYADFGLNKTLSEYFEVHTFAEILLAREYFVSNFDQLNDEQSMIMSCVMHVLHGNRPYALSRTSHPLTPYAPKGPFEYKNLIDHVDKKIQLTYSSDCEPDSIKGKALNLNYSDILVDPVDAIITSPPFAGSMKFYSQNWLRLWFSGWEPEDFEQADQRFLDAKQMKDINVYDSFFQKCDDLLKPDGILILHLGNNSKMDMAKALLPIAERYFSVAYEFCEDVQNLERHGIKDKGGTIEHQFAFLEKRSQRLK